MKTENGGDTGGNQLPRDSASGRQPLSNLFSSGGGEVFIPLAFDDAEKKELLAHAEGNRGIVSPSLITPKVQTSTEGKKTSLESKTKPGVCGPDKGQGQGPGARKVNSGMDLFTVILGVAGLSLVAFFICLVATRVIMAGCGWTMCIRIHARGPEAQYPQNKRFSKHETPGHCVYHRFEPNFLVPVLEVIHDFNSRHSALIEYRHGLRCLLFDMKPYISEASSCPASYPSSLDERLGVPARKTKFARAFPRRYARHFFTHLAPKDSAELRDIIGPTILERCKHSQLYVALLVEARMETSRCQPAQQFIVDEMLAMSDPEYIPRRSRALSNMFAFAVTMYENWYKYEKNSNEIEIDAVVTTPGAKRLINEEILLKETKAGIFIEARVVKTDIAKISQNHKPLESRPKVVDRPSTRNTQRGELKSEHDTGSDGGRESPAANLALETHEGETHGPSDDRSKESVQEKIKNTAGDDVEVILPSQTTRANEDENEPKHLAETAANAEESKQPKEAIDKAPEAMQAKGAIIDTRAVAITDKQKQKIGDDSSEVDVEPLPADFHHSSAPPSASFGKIREKRSEGRRNEEPRSIDVAMALEGGKSTDSTSGSERQPDKSDPAAAKPKSLLSLVYPAFEITELPRPKVEKGWIDGADLFRGLPVKSEVRSYYSWNGDIVRVCLRRSMP